MQRSLYSFSFVVANTHQCDGNVCYKSCYPEARKRPYGGTCSSELLCRWWCSSAAPTATVLKCETRFGKSPYTAQSYGRALLLPPIDYKFVLESPVIIWAIGITFFDSITANMVFIPILLLLALTATPSNVFAGRPYGGGGPPAGYTHNGGP